MSKLKYLIVILIPVVVAATFVWLLRPIKAENPEQQIKTVVAFGDSLVKGVGASEGKDFVSNLSQKIGKPVQNFGISGNTSAQALARIDTVINADPDLVILLIGGNDALQKVTVQETFSNIRSIITKLKANDIQVVLLGIQGGAIGDPYASEFKAVAKDLDLIFVPNVISGLFGKSEFMADAVHPNDAGYSKISDKVYEAIKPLF
jgi:acyl-CoA thioesterase I